MTETKRLEEYDCVTLVRDLPEHGLKAGDSGAVVMDYGADDYEVEFMDAEGRTTALLTLNGKELRRAGEV